MEFPTSYLCLSNNKVVLGDYSIIPIRYEDRLKIMKWRNEQMYHLRQKELLTLQNQETYFNTVVATLFSADTPSQILFSYCHNNECVGYGGLVHINWERKEAEISFIMDTQLEDNFFEIHWTNFLKLITKVAFNELKIKKVFTYAYNLRPHLYPVLEKNRFEQKARLKNEIEIEGKQIDVLIHEKRNPYYLIHFRESNAKDVQMIYDWSNDPVVRNQSFNQEPIVYENHKEWFENKLKSGNSLLLINEFEGNPAGLIRFEVEKEHTTIGILINQEYRGKGLATDMLIKSSQFYFNKFNQPIWAFIKENNQASVKSFTRAGFIFSHTTQVNDAPSLVYKLQKL